MSAADTKPRELDVLFEQAMKFSPEQRLALSERLLLSVPPPGQDRTEEEWKREIERRIKEHEADPTTAIPLEDALKEARRIANETALNSSGGQSGTQ